MSILTRSRLELSLAPGQVDFDATTRYEQAADLQCRAWRRRGKELLPHLIEIVEIVQVGQEHLRLYDVVERAAGGLEHALKIAEDVARLLLDVRSVVWKGRILPGLLGDAGRHMRSELSRGIKHVADEHPLAVVRHRRRRTRGPDHPARDASVHCRQVDFDPATGNEQRA